MCPFIAENICLLFILMGIPKQVCKEASDLCHNKYVPLLCLYLSVINQKLHMRESSTCAWLPLGQRGPGKAPGPQIYHPGPARSSPGPVLRRFTLPMDPFHIPCILLSGLDRFFFNYKILHAGKHPILKN